VVLLRRHEEILAEGLRPVEAACICLVRKVPPLLADLLPGLQAGRTPMEPDLRLAVEDDAEVRLVVLALLLPCVYLRRPPVRLD
jgi:hypothetical protein